jgi:methane/ammonia monooxygenase subunit C
MNTANRVSVHSLSATSAAPKLVGSEEERVRGSQQRSSREVPYRSFFAICVTLAAASLVFIYAWQHAWWFPIGLDSTTWEFHRYWLNLLYVELAVTALAGLAMVLAFRRPCRECEGQRRQYGRILPEHEIGHIGKLWSMVAIAAAFAIGVSFFGEQDASWHQIVVRDTAFTPSHIPLFFYTFPLLIVLVSQASWYAYHRLHHLYVGENGRGLPVAYLLFPAGALILFGNVAFNELGHSSWITEELFVQPFHFPFAWATYFFLAAVGVLFPVLPRLFEDLAEIARSKAGAADAGRTR